MKYISSLVDRALVALVSRPAVASALEARGFATKCEVSLAMKNADENSAEIGRKLAATLDDCVKSRMDSLESSIEDIKTLDESDIESIIDDRVPSMIEDEVSDFCYSRSFRDEVDERIDNMLGSIVKRLSDSQLDALDAALSNRRAEREANKQTN